MTAHPPLPTHDQIAVSDAVRHVRCAGAHLREATFRLDEGGLHCEALEDIAADASALVAIWAGRAVAVMDTVPPHIATSAEEWRRHAGRSY